MMKHPSCHEMLGELSEYLDGEASALLCAEIERHMGGCENCRIVVDTLRKTLTLYHRLPHPPLPDEARKRLYKVLDLKEFLPSD